MKQTTLTLREFPRGVHLITADVAAALRELGVAGNGLVHVFIQHTSASVCINENADPDVRLDMEDFLQRLAPDAETHLYRHTAEGADDMTSHIKASLVGSNVTIPMTNGRLNLGTWQGMYLCEHRMSGGKRTLVITVTE